MKPVTVYVKKVCPYCHQALEFLKKNGIAHRVVSIDYEEGMLEWSRLGAAGVPTFVIGRTVIAGFSEYRLKDALLNN